MSGALLYYVAHELSKKMIIRVVIANDVRNDFA